MLYSVHDLWSFDMKLILMNFANKLPKNKSYKNITNYLFYFISLFIISGILTIGFCKYNNTNYYI